MKIGTVTPSRGKERERFRDMAVWLIERQSRQPDIMVLVASDPSDGSCDLAGRYMEGFDTAFHDGCDLVLAMEDDDYYDSSYVSVMQKSWAEAGCPDVFGNGVTLNYHLVHRGWRERVMSPQPRASMFQTALTEKAFRAFDWEAAGTKNNFMDRQLWTETPGGISKGTFIDSNLALGMKHGVGVCASKSHHGTFWRDNRDPDCTWLRAFVGEEAWAKFYEELVEDLRR